MPQICSASMRQIESANMLCEIGFSQLDDLLHGPHAGLQLGVALLCTPAIADSVLHPP